MRLLSFLSWNLLFPTCDYFISVLCLDRKCHQIKSQCRNETDRGSKVKASDEEHAHKHTKTHKRHRNGDPPWLLTQSLQRISCSMTWRAVVLLAPCFLTDPDAGPQHEHRQGQQRIHVWFLSWAPLKWLDTMFAQMWGSGAERPNSLYPSGGPGLPWGEASCSHAFRPIVGDITWMDTEADCATLSRESVWKTSPQLRSCSFL